MSSLNLSLSLFNSERVPQDLVLATYVVQCIEHTSNAMHQHPDITFTHDDRLPDILNCDIEILVNTLQVLTEFSLKYCVDDK